MANSEARCEIAARPSCSLFASSNSLINADPTMTPSAYAANDFACSRVDTPKPTEIGKSVTVRTRATNLRRKQSHQFWR